MTRAKRAVATCVFGCPRRAKARGLCHACYCRMKRHGRIHRFPLSKSVRPVSEVLEDLDLLEGTGVSPLNWHARLGMSPAALERALYRAGRRQQGRLVSQVRRQVAR